MASQLTMDGTTQIRHNTPGASRWDQPNLSRPAQAGANPTCHNQAPQSPRELRCYSTHRRCSLSWPQTFGSRADRLLAGERQSHKCDCSGVSRISPAVSESGRAERRLALRDIGEVDARALGSAALIRVADGDRGCQCVDDDELSESASCCSHLHRQRRSADHEGDVGK